MYTYVLGARGERTRSLRGVIRERRTGDGENERVRKRTERKEEIDSWIERERKSERERVIYREYEVEEGRENTTRRGPRVEEGGHWDARNESLLVVAMGSRTVGSPWDVGLPCASDGKGYEGRSSAKSVE